MIMTKNELITQLKKEYATIREGSDQQGYVELSTAEYNERISQWADNMLAKQAEAQAKLDARAAAEAKLTALGLTADDLAALGL